MLLGQVAEEVEPALAKLRTVEARGGQTRLSESVRQVLTELRGAPPSAIVLMTDGQTTDGEALAKAKLPGNRIELEVTESVFMDGSDGSLDVLKRLRTLGVGIALDDFGTGYSSLGYLNKAVFHKLKIDGSFVREAGTRPETIEIIKSIVQLARSFRLNVTAEGIETVEDFERMRDLGCNTMQGYLFGRPMPYARANELVMGQARRKSA